MPQRIVLTGLFATTLPTSVFAHGGHLGELAGHSHRIGAAALAGAALVAGLVAWQDRKMKTSDESPEAGADAEVDSSAEPEAAQ